MKLQYLGDSKDCFKWDYHDHLISELRLKQLQIILMLTPDDRTRDGNTLPELFPAKPKIISFCNELRGDRDLQKLSLLPSVGRGTYNVNLHKADTFFTNNNREQYFSGLSVEEDCLFLLDPDNGFEPERSRNSKHVSYEDVSRILDCMSDGSVISVFQHFRRIPFGEDFERIRERLGNVYSAAIHWHSLMFVTIAKAERAIEKVIAANSEYENRHSGLIKALH